MSDGGFMRAPRGPERYIGQPLKVLGMDAYSSVGILPVIIFPFAPLSWFIAIVIFISISVANYFKLPSYQLIRYLRVKMSPTVIPPHPEQLNRDRWSSRRWPY